MTGTGRATKSRGSAADADRFNQGVGELSESCDAAGRAEAIISSSDRPSTRQGVPCRRRADGRQVCAATAKPALVVRCQRGRIKRAGRDRRKGKGRLAKEGKANRRRNRDSWRNAGHAKRASTKEHEKRMMHCNRFRPHNRPWSTNYSSSAGAAAAARSLGFCEYLPNRAIGSSRRAPRRSHLSCRSTTSE